MSQELKHALIAFARAFFAAMVGAAVVYITGVDLSAVTNVEVLAKGLVMAVITGGLKFLGDYLRATTTQPVQMPQTPRARATTPVGGPHLARTKSWADLLPV